MLNTSDTSPLRVEHQMDSRLKAIASQDRAWTEIAEKEEQLEKILKNGFQDESDIVLVKDAITLVLAEIAWRKVELAKLQSDNECELVIGGTYQINFTDMEQGPSTWYDGPATFVSLDDDDYESGKQHCLFRIGMGEDEEVTSFPLTAVGKRLK